MKPEQIEFRAKSIGMKDIKWVMRFVFVVCALQACMLVSQKKECTNYRYMVHVCDNCFGAWFYTDSISWDNSMLIAEDHYGKLRMVKPIEVEEGCFESCKTVTQ